MSIPLHPVLAEVTDRLRQRSAVGRTAYLTRITAARAEGTQRRALSCGNLAHGFAACNDIDKQHLRGLRTPNIGIVKIGRAHV